MTPKISFIVFTTMFVEVRQLFFLSYHTYVLLGKIEIEATEKESLLDGITKSIVVSLRGYEAWQRNYIT